MAKTVKILTDTGTGQYTTEEYADKHTKTTVVETVNKPTYVV